MRRRFVGWAAALSLGVLFYSGVLRPLIAVFGEALIAADFSDPVAWSIARVTLWQAFLSTLFSVLIGLPLGLWVGSYGRRSRIWNELLLALPFGVPSVVAGLAWVALLGRSGLFAQWGIHALNDWAYSLKAVILAHVFLNAPWIALLVSHARAQASHDQLESAASLGAGAFARFRYVIWPQLRWVLAAGAAQVLALCAMSFALVLILGGGPPVQTLETALYSRLRYGSMNVSGAAVIGVLQLGITLIPWLVVLLVQTRKSNVVPLFKKVPDEYQPRSRIPVFILTLVCLVFLLPYMGVISWGSLRGLFSRESATEVWPAIKTSLTLAAWTGLGSLIWALMGVYSMSSLKEIPGASLLVAVLVSLPSGISALVLGLGLWISYQQWIDPFSGSMTAMVFLQIVLFTPIAFRMLWPLIAQKQVALLDSAATLGASPWKAFWIVEWPRWRGPVLSALLVVAAASLGEVAAVSLFYSEQLIPLPLLISRWFGQYRFEDAQAVAALLFVLSAGVTAIAFLGRGYIERSAR